jgi:hypothetical protein
MDVEQAGKYLRERTKFLSDRSGKAVDVLLAEIDRLKQYAREDKEIHAKMIALVAESSQAHEAEKERLRAELAAARAEVGRLRADLRTCAACGLSWHDPKGVILCPWCAARAEVAGLEADIEASKAAPPRPRPTREELGRLIHASDIPESLPHSWAELGGIVREAYCRAADAVATAIDGAAQDLPTGATGGHAGDFLASVDASVWAREFCEVVGAKVAGLAAEQDWITTWFANAIMAGYDKGKALPTGAGRPAEDCGPHPDALRLDFLERHGLDVRRSGGRWGVWGWMPPGGNVLAYERATAESSIRMAIDAAMTKLGEAGPLPAAPWEGRS